MSSSLNVAILQLTSVDNIEQNFSQIKDLIESVDNHVRLFCLPENSLYMRLVEGEKIRGLNISDSVFQKLAELAKKKKAYIHVGSVPLLIENELFNSSVLISDTGDIQPSYQKIHLFDIHLKDQTPIRESDVFRHGLTPQIFVVDGWKIAQTICYDIRFSELFYSYALAEVDAILIPAAFLVKTGQAHWEILIRARAIESQCYVLAAAQSGLHINEKKAQRETFGHSMIVDPWGHVLNVLSEAKPGILIQTLEKSRIQEVRTQIPMHSHRRLKSLKPTP